MTNLEFKTLLSEGRTSLVIGLLFLSACLVLSNVLLGNKPATWAEITRESLTIAGWVAMWRPMQIYLYDWCRCGGVAGFTANSVACRWKWCSGRSRVELV